MDNLSKIYQFENESSEYVYSGVTGLLVENSSRIRDFISSGMEDEELKSYIYGDGKEFTVSGQNPLRSITVFCTNYCNLSCVYCYHKENNLNNSENMDIGLFGNAIEFLLENTKTSSKININFFGGEPLLNFEFVKEAIRLLKELEAKQPVVFTYSMTTNGTVYSSEIMDFILQNEIGLLISIDGEKEAHDTTRKFLSGKGSYDTVIANVDHISKYVDVPARVTITDLDTNLVKLYENLISAGFSGVTVAVASVKDSPFDFETQKDLLKNRLKELADYILMKLKNKEAVYFTNYLRILTDIHKGHKHFFPCSAAKNSFALSARGELYLCHRFNNVDEYRLGDIDKGLDKDKIKEFLNTHNVLGRDTECTDCWAGLLCGGICYHSSYTDNDDSRKKSSLDCFFNKEIIKNSLYIYSSLDEDTLNLFDNMGEI